MILEAGRNGCAREVLIITAALSIQDPRERPADAREAADAMHARFAEPGSDFLAFLTLWDYLRDQQRELSGVGVPPHVPPRVPALPAGARVAGRVRPAPPGGAEVGSAPAGTAAAAADRARRSRRTRYPADLADRVHMSLLAGLLSHIGMQDTEPQPGGKRRGPAEFAGARGARFAIFPDSVLARKPPPWVVAAELVETSRLWARTAARIEPEWAEPLAAHLVKRSYSEPHWDASRGAAMALGEGNACTACRSWPTGRSTTPGSTRRPPATCSSPPRWSRATGRPTTSSSRRNQRLLDEAGGPGGPGQAARHRRRRRGPFRLLRPADTRGRDLRPALRRLVEEGPRGRPRTC